MPEYELTAPVPRQLRVRAHYAWNGTSVTLPVILLTVAVLAGGLLLWVLGLPPQLLGPLGAACWLLGVVMSEGRWDGGYATVTLLCDLLAALRAPRQFAWEAAWHEAAPPAALPAAARPRWAAVRP